MNRQEKDILRALFTESPELAKQELRRKAPRNAVILAAGFGMRMVPINLETPKALLEVHGEPLIERMIRQLHQAGITAIYVVVGFMKERFEYLVDEYGVELVNNPEYAVKDNLWSLRLVLDKLSNSYIIPCDIWCDRNPFKRYELYSWYMVSDLLGHDSDVQVNHGMELVTVPSDGNAMTGICYLREEDCETIRDCIQRLCQDSRNDDALWETALYEEGRMIIPARMVRAAGMIEINTYEQLRQLDGESRHLRSDALEVIADVFDTTCDSVTDITALKKGMTNRSFQFICNGEKYIMRIPGEGTEQLINRKQEADVYEAIKGKGFCDDPVYINPNNGYKITKFLDSVRVADPKNEQELERCMGRLRAFHEMGLVVDHEFDIFGQIEFYETLWEGQCSVYKDYTKTKADVLSLRPYIESHVQKKVLTHIDAVPDNFLFYTTEGTEKLQLTDWEYAGMQDPHVDIAMFCIYSLYDRNQVDRLIDIYFEDQCTRKTRIKIYCYIAACGLLWSNWCEYKSRLGVEFGEYSLRQYGYAKDYYKIVLDEMGEESLKMQEEAKNGE